MEDISKGCANGSKSLALIPKPVSVEQGEGSFALSSDTVLVADEASAPAEAQLAALLQPATSFNLAMASSADHDGTVIALAQVEDMGNLGSEGYRVAVDLDLEKFFDLVNHDVLMARVARRVADRVLRLAARRIDGPPYPEAVPLLLYRWKRANSGNGGPRTRPHSNGPAPNRDLL